MRHQTPPSRRKDATSVLVKSDWSTAKGSCSAHCITLPSKGVHFQFQEGLSHDPPVVGPCCVPAKHSCVLAHQPHCTPLFCVCRHEPQSVSVTHCGVALH